MSETAQLIVAFPDQSESFTLGFEAGTLWVRMQAGEEVIESGMPYHTQNHDVFANMAAALGYWLDVGEADDSGTWTYFTFLKQREPPKRSRFQVITGGLSE